MPGDAPTANGREGQEPLVVHRDGLAYVQGCDVPIWQLEMSRRAGSRPAAMLRVFLGLTDEGLDAAIAYAREHSDEIDALIRERGPVGVSPGDEGEDDPEETRGSRRNLQGIWPGLPASGPMKYLSLKTVLAIHERSLQEYGGDPGVRDQGLLESAVAQPRARFGGEELYASLAEKAAALAFSLVKNHPFFDGNKRTGYGAMLMFLSRNGHAIQAPLEQHEATFISLAAGTMSREELRAWLEGVIVRKGRS